MKHGSHCLVLAGAKDESNQSAYLREATTSTDDPLSVMVFLFSTGSMLWINEDGERSVDENCISITSGCMTNTTANQKQPWGIFTSQLLDGSAIAGLYAVGNDSCHLFGGTYTISVPGCFNGNKVYSGRNAAKNAITYFG
jgi:hypothetical protein